MKDQTMQIPGLQDEKKSFIIMEPRSQSNHDRQLYLANSANSDPQPPTRHMPVAYNITQQSQPIDPVVQQSIRTSHSHAPLNNN